MGAAVIGDLVVVALVIVMFVMMGAFIYISKHGVPKGIAERFTDRKKNPRHPG